MYIYIQQLINLYQFSRINQQLTNQLLINLLFASLQVSKLVLRLFTVSPGGSLYLPPGVFPQLGVVLKINEILMNFQYPKNHQKLLARPPKVIKMRSQELPKVVKISKVLKK